MSLCPFFIKKWKKKNEVYSGNRQRILKKNKMTHAHTYAKTCVCVNKFITLRFKLTVVVFFCRVIVTGLIPL